MFRYHPNHHHRCQGIENHAMGMRLLNRHNHLHRCQGILVRFQERQYHIHLDIGLEPYLNLHHQTHPYRHRTIE